ncbi:hypothetical protein AAMO2058_000323900 [Amorphochlora amoebiformis]
MSRFAFGNFGDVIKPFDPTDHFAYLRPEPGRWECNACLLSNVPSLSCAACGTPNPDPTWECKTCSMTNDHGSDTCKACGTVSSSKRNSIGSSHPTERDSLSRFQGIQLEGGGGWGELSTQGDFGNNGNSFQKKPKRNKVKYGKAQTSFSFPKESSSLTDSKGLMSEKEDFKGPPSSDMNEWTVRETASYAMSIGKSNIWKSYAKIFMKEEIDGATLMEANVEVLVELGLRKQHAHALVQKTKKRL